MDKRILERAMAFCAEDLVPTAAIAAVVAFAIGWVAGIRASHRYVLNPYGNDGFYYRWQFPSIVDVLSSPVFWVAVALMAFLQLWRNNAGGWPRAKRTLDLVIVSTATGRSPGWGRGFVRTLGAILDPLSLLPFRLSIWSSGIWMHDLVSGCRVIHDENTESAFFPARRRPRTHVEEIRFQQRQERRLEEDRLRAQGLLRGARRPDD